MIFRLVLALTAALHRITRRARLRRAAGLNLGRAS
jgi:hypothetical protein